MPKYFRRDKYQIDMLSKEYFKKWIEENPQFKGKIDYPKWKRYWKYFRTEFYSEVLTNTSGVDLDLEMGNISIKILDVAFKCEKDLLSTTRNYNNEGTKRIPVPSPEITKKGKIVWKKHTRFKYIPSYMGMESCKSFRTMVGRGIRNRTHYYQKLSKEIVTSRCDDTKPVSLYDLA